MHAPILIIGAGLGGLSLAQGLRKLGIHFQVFERDADLTSRPQGYRIRIHGDGIAALESALDSDVWDEVKKTFARDDGETLTKVDLETGEKEPQPGKGRPQGSRKARGADRRTLRDALLLGIRERVVFGKTFDRYEAGEDSVTAFFSDGSSATGSLLVGAEGVRSIVRQQHVPDLKILDTEGNCIYGKTQATPQLLAQIPHHSLTGMTLGQEKIGGRLMTLLLEPIYFERDTGAQTPLPEDYIYWVLVSQAKTFSELIETATTSASSPPSAADLAAALTKNLHPSLRVIFEQQDRAQTSMLRIVTVAPNLSAWPSCKRVTLLGDAAHVMSPTGGYGSTAVFKDVARLYKMLENDGITNNLVSEYEQGLRDESRQYVELSLQGGKFMFGLKDVADLNVTGL